MTSTVIVKAHCSEHKEVVVILGGETTKLQDGETREFHIYDSREISVRETYNSTKINNLLNILDETISNWALYKNKEVKKIGSDDCNMSLSVDIPSFKMLNAINIVIERLEELYTENNYSDKNYFTYVISACYITDVPNTHINFNGFRIQLKAYIY